MYFTTCQLHLHLWLALSRYQGTIQNSKSSTKQTKFHQTRVQRLPIYWLCDVVRSFLDAMIRCRAKSCSSVCPALVFSWHQTLPSSGELQGALCLTSLDLCWHRTQPEIGQLQGGPLQAATRRRVSPASVRPWSLLATGCLLAPDTTRKRTTSRCAHYELPRKEALLQCLRGVGLYWHRTHQKADNFKVPIMIILSCHEKRRCSSVCPALVFEAMCHHFPNMPPWSPDLAH